jgi:predicted Zn-dependent peptidase
MLFGGGMSSRLFQRIREELGLAYSVYSFQSFHEDAGMHGVYVGTTPDSARAAVDAINAELEKLSSEGLSEEDITAGKSQLKGQITLSLESPTSRMYRAAGTELYREPYRTLDELLALIDAIDAQTVAEICKSYYPPARQTLVSLGPRATA